MEDTEEKKQGKPLYDARAKYSGLLVDLLTSINKYLQLGDVDGAFRTMVNYYHLTRPYIENNTYKQEILKDINEANDIRDNHRQHGYESETITERSIDKILPKLTSYTSHLLLPMQESGEDDEDDL